MRCLLCVLFSFQLVLGFSQNNYETTLAQYIQKLDEAKTPEDYRSVAAYFERTGLLQKTDWLPYYYAAYALLNSALIDEKQDKDDIASKVNDLLTTADNLSPNNSEIYCLKSLSATVQLLVNPMLRWPTYGTEAASALEKAKQLDPSNPRPYFLEANHS